MLAIALSASVAVAQPTPDHKARALTLFQQSDLHYKRGEFERAVELLRAAHALHAEPLLLYNLARALEGLGDLPGAIAQYERYLKDAVKIEDRGAIERRIATLQAQLAARADGGAAPEPGGAGAGPGTSPRSGSKDLSQGAQSGPQRSGGLAPRGGRRIDAGASASSRRRPWYVAGGGVAVLGAGAVFGYLSQSKNDRAQAEPVQAEAVRLQDRALRDARIANVLFVAGGAIVVGGVVWGVLDRRQHARAPVTVAGAQVSIAPTWVGLTWELP